MHTLFIDVSDVRQLYMSTPVKHTGQTGTHTENDFEKWLFEAINFLGLIYTDFGLGSDNVKSDGKLLTPVTDFDGLDELYVIIKDLFTHPELSDKEVLSSYGFKYGDLVYFQVELGVSDE